MEFIHGFVIDFGRRCIERVHRRGKLAYVFYDDHWIGVEPNSPRFAEFGFDGLIKCVFNAFEVRLCAHARGVRTHELRLHPYLFPTGLKGEPTFKPGGDPTRDAQELLDRRAARAPARAASTASASAATCRSRSPFPIFRTTIEALAREFRLLKSLHASAAGPGPRRSRSPCSPPGATCAPGPAPAISRRAWSSTPCSSRSPACRSTSGSSASTTSPATACRRGCGWSSMPGGPARRGRGGHYWSNPEIEAILTRWVRRGGGLIGIGEPSELPRPGQRFRLAQVLGARPRRRRTGRQRQVRVRAPAGRGGGALHHGRPARGRQPRLRTGRSTASTSSGPDTQVLAERGRLAAPGHASASAGAARST